MNKDNTSSIEFFHESCVDTLDRMIANNTKVDLVITSPPYNMNLRIRANPKTGIRSFCSRQLKGDEFSSKYAGVNRDELVFYDNLPVDEFFEFHKSVLNKLLCVSPIVFYNIQIVTGSKRAFFKLIGEFSDNLKDIIVWDKKHAEPAMQNGVINRQSELILVFERDTNQAISRQFEQNIAQFERGELSDIWQISRERNKDKSLKHGATFPTELIRKILTNFSKENDLVYDPFSGTGTTAFVCKEMNRRFIGSEIIQEYVDYSKKRCGLNDTV